MFGAAKSTKNADIDKYQHSRYGMDLIGSFSLSDDSGFGKHVVIFGADMNSSVHVDNKKKDTLILAKGPADASDDCLQKA